MGFRRLACSCAACLILAMATCVGSAAEPNTPPLDSARDGPPAPGGGPELIAGPLLRVGLAWHRPSVAVAGPGGFVVSAGDQEWPGQHVPWTAYLPAAAPDAAQAETRPAAADVYLVDAAGAGRWCPLPVRIRPAPGYAEGLLAGPDGAHLRRYEGELELTRDAGGLLALVNVVDLEAYARGVVCAEMEPDYPPEALKAQAVAARSVALSTLGRHRADGFDICAEPHCQAYRGLTGQAPQGNAAVAATAGQVLFYDGRPANAVYHAACGGHTEDASEVWGGPQVPYLRGVSDREQAGPSTLRPAQGRPEQRRGATSSGPPQGAGGPSPAESRGGNPGPEGYRAEDQKLRDYLTSAPPVNCRQPEYLSPTRFRWVRVLTREQIESSLRDIVSIGGLVELRPLQRGVSGRVMRLEARGTQGASVLSPEYVIRQTLGGLPSSAFVVDRYCDDAGRPVVFVFWGGGWGHGVGMCQVGAAGLAKAGRSYREILAKYYSGAEIKTMY